MSGQRSTEQLPHTHADQDHRPRFVRVRTVWACALVIILSAFALLFWNGRLGATPTATPTAAPAPAPVSPHSLTPNPTCLHAPGYMGDQLTGCIQATPAGLTFIWTGYTHYSAAVQYVQFEGVGISTGENVTCTLPTCTKSYPLAPGEYAGRTTLVTVSGASAEIGFDLLVKPSDPPLPQPISAPIIGMVATPDGQGYWEAGADGTIYPFGDVVSYGSLAGVPLNKPIVGMAATPDGKGYWLLGGDGGVFSFGDAGFYGSVGGQVLNQPVVGMAATPDGKGYWLVASDGGIFTFGDAPFFGSAGDLPLVKPVVGMAVDPATGGYWIVASDGGVFSFNAPFYGSTGNIVLAQPIVGMESAPDGTGYRFVASDGGVFDFNQSFEGSLGGQVLPAPIVGMASDTKGGYWLVGASAVLTPFGGAAIFGPAG
jgi:hypothetical protein